MNLSACNWCNRDKQLLIGKRYCKDCDLKRFRECCRCHRPFDHPKYFQLDPIKLRCDACQRKLLQEQTKARKMKSTKVIESDSDEAVNIMGSDVSTDDEVKKPTRKPAFLAKKQTVKRAPKTQTRRKKTSCDQVEALKTLICQWSQEEVCMKRILDGKQMALVPIFF